MGGFKELLKAFYYIIKKKRLIEKYGCKFGKFTQISQESKFEGRNLMARGSKLIDSYIGYGSYLGESANLKRCYIGRYSSIGPLVQNIVGKHPTNFVSTHPAFFSLRKQVGFTYVNEQKYDEFEDLKYDGYATRIGNDVWVGAGAVLLEGINIGDGAVIGTGAVVLKDVPPYAIVGGVPAKVLRYRFQENEIDFLLKLCWWEKDQEWIAAHADLFENINKLREKVGEEM